MQTIRPLTMPTMTARSKANVLFRERVASLVGDGFRVLFSSTGVTANMWFVSLRHTNGNKVTLSAHWDTNKLIQRTNGVVVHESSLY